MKLPLSLGDCYFYRILNGYFYFSFLCFRMIETKRSEVDAHGEDFSIKDVKYVGGLDMSYCSEYDDDLVHARAALVVTEFPEEHPTSGTKNPEVTFMHSLEYGF